MTMSILNRLYASSGTEVIIETLQITAGSEVYYVTKGFEDVTATLENGQTVTFEAGGIDLALPAKNTDGTQDLKFAIGNINGRVSKAIRAALAAQIKGLLTYRGYVSTDLSAPSERPFTLAIKSGSWSATEVQISAGYMNILDKAWPRRRYTLADFPGLRHIP